MKFRSRPRGNRKNYGKTDFSSLRAFTASPLLNVVILLVIYSFIKDAFTFTLEEILRYIRPIHDSIYGPVEAGVDPLKVLFPV